MDSLRTSPGTTPLLCLSVAAARGNVGLVRHVVGGLADHGAIGHVALRPIVLGVSEAVTQAVLVGGPGDRVDVRIWLARDGAVRVVVTDDGDPTVASRNGGLSRSTMAAVARSVEVRPSPTGGTELEMWFVPAPGQSSPLL